MARSRLVAEDITGIIGTISAASEKTQRSRSRTHSDGIGSSIGLLPPDPREGERFVRRLVGLDWVRPGGTEPLVMDGPGDPG